MLRITGGGVGHAVVEIEINGEKYIVDAAPNLGPLKSAHTIVLPEQEYMNAVNAANPGKNVISSPFQAWFLVGMTEAAARTHYPWLFPTTNR